MIAEIASHYNLSSDSTFGEGNHRQTLNPTSQPASLRSPEFASLAQYQQLFSPQSYSMSQSEDSTMQDDCQSEKSYLHLLKKLAAHGAVEIKLENSEGFQD